MAEENRRNTKETKLIRAEGHVIKRVKQGLHLSVKSRRNSVVDVRRCSGLFCPH